MDKVRFPKKFKVYLPLILLFAILLLMMPRNAKLKYDYRKGAEWKHETLKAQIDFPLLKTEAELAQEREMVASEFIPYFKVQDDVAPQVVAAVNSKEGSEQFNLLKPELVRILVGIYEKGVMDKGRYPDVESVYITVDNTISLCPVSELYSPESAGKAIRTQMRGNRLVDKADSLCRNMGIYDLIYPNLVFDQQTSDLIQAEAYDRISPTKGYVSAGTTIVEKGAVVTPDILQTLESYNKEYNENFGYDGPEWLLWLGNAVLAFVLVAILFMSIYYSNFRIFEQMNRYLYLLMIFALSTIAALLADKANPNILYLIPFTLIAQYLLAFFKKKVVFPAYMISLLPLLIFANNGIELFVMFLAAGTVSIFSSEYFYKGWQQFITAFFVFITLFAVDISFKLIDGGDLAIDLMRILYLALGSLLTVAGYPLIYLFEKIFNLVSQTRLVELCDTNNKLLRDLAHKAPGTFQHSLQVMNMCDEAARSIEANVHLIRAGAMYHDIGKMKNPQCFVENAAPGVNYHAGLSNKESAQEIIRHVSDGMQMASKYGLPEMVSDFIISHHGTSCAAYFMTRYLNEGGDENDVSAFYYNGRKPVTKEQAILMLCDSLEAASRTLQDFSYEAVSAFVDNMTRSKMDQFDNSEISLQELNQVKETLKNYICQVHHSRIAYPKRNTK